LFPPVVRFAAFPTSLVTSAVFALCDALALAVDGTIARPRRSPERAAPVEVADFWVVIR
jgi:hypothetical protein